MRNAADNGLTTSARMAAKGLSRYPDRLSRMKVMMASNPGHVGQPNEDFVGAVPGAVVLLDGAGIPGTDSICRHGVAWYSQLSARPFSGSCPANLERTWSQLLPIRSDRYPGNIATPATSPTPAVPSQPWRSFDSTKMAWTF